MCVFLGVKARCVACIAAFNLETCSRLARIVLCAACSTTSVIGEQRKKWRWRWREDEFRNDGEQNLVLVWLRT
jgi:hypothetical protein